jgi:hypothetical protein
MIGGQSRGCFSLGSAVSLTILVLVQAAAPRSAAAVDLEQANLRWRDARCQLRIPLAIGKKKNSMGWSYSPWYQVTEYKPDFAFRFYVSDRQQISHLLYDKTLHAGTTFICQGWRMPNPKKSRGLWLDLRFADLPVDAHIEFLMKRPDKNFANPERYMRVTAFQIQATDEQLVQVPTTTAPVRTAPVTGPAPPRAAPPRPPALPPQVESEPAAPELRIIAVAVQPARAAPGEEIAMVISYEVDGVPPGSSFEVLERREILRGAQRLAGFEERLRRTGGTFTSSQSVRLPPDVERGLYTLWAELAMAGGKTTGSALFEVSLGAR